MYIRNCKEIHIRLFIKVKKSTSDYSLKLNKIKN